MTFSILLTIGHLLDRQLSVELHVFSWHRLNLNILYHSCGAAMFGSAESQATLFEQLCIC